MQHQVSTTNSSVQLPDGILAKDNTYLSRVRTILNGETGPWSDVWNFTFVNAGLKETESNLPSLILTPNPGDVAIKISYKIPAIEAGQFLVNIEIVNSLGKITNKLVNNKQVQAVTNFN